MLPALPPTLSANVVNLIKDNVSKLFDPPEVTWGEHEDFKALGHGNQDLAVHGLVSVLSCECPINRFPRGHFLAVAVASTHCGSH